MLERQQEGQGQRDVIVLQRVRRQQQGQDEGRSGEISRIGIAFPNKKDQTDSQKPENDGNDKPGNSADTECVSQPIVDRRHNALPDDHLWPVESICQPLTKAGVVELPPARDGDRRRAEQTGRPSRAPAERGRFAADQPDSQAEHHEEGRLRLGQRQDQAQSGQDRLVSPDAAQGQRQAEEQHEAQRSR